MFYCMFFRFHSIALAAAYLVIEFHDGAPDGAGRFRDRLGHGRIPLNRGRAADRPGLWVCPRMPSW
jgi:hypothetical protein